MRGVAFSPNVFLRQFFECLVAGDLNDAVGKEFVSSLSKLQGLAVVAFPGFVALARWSMSYIYRRAMNGLRSSAGCGCFCMMPCMSFQLTPKFYTNSWVIFSTASSHGKRILIYSEFIHIFIWVPCAGALQQSR